MLGVASVHHVLAWASLVQVGLLGLLLLVSASPRRLGGVVLGSSQGGDCVKLQEGVHGLGIRRPGVGNGLPLREHLILARIKRELYPCAGAPTRTRGECRLPDTSGKNRLLLVSLHFRIYFPRLALFRLETWT